MHNFERLSFDGAIDGDGHILEPPDLWQRYLEPAFRKRAPTIRKDAEGLEYLEIDGRSSSIVRGGMPAGLGAMDRVGGQVFEREAVTGLRYVDEAALGAMDASERIRRLDFENLKKVFIYPTLTLFWIAECEDEGYTQACLQAYNRWIVDFCSDSVGPTASCRPAVPRRSCGGRGRSPPRGGSRRSRRFCSAFSVDTEASG